jgi:predicted DNA binding protein
MTLGLFKGTSPKVLYCDMDGDGVCEIITQKLRSVTIEMNGEVCWKSDMEWKCDDFLVADIDGDGANEFLVLLWKKGSFGEHTPFWKENDDEISQHIFIYEWSEEKGRIAPVWMSSKLIPEISSWDINEDNQIHIITMSGEDTLWIWGSWGLERIDTR